jgi:hypothetical protein
MAAKMRITKATRPVLLAVAIALSVGGYVVTRPDSSEVFVPFLPEASVAIDAPPDAAIDAPIDAPPGEPPPMEQAWPRWAILSVATGSTLKGSDGVAVVDLNGDGNLDITVGWEQSGKTSVTLHPGCGAPSKGSWSSVALPVTTTGVEDATFGDVDSDGRQDVVSSGSSGFRLYVHFAPATNGALLTPSSWTGVVINASINAQRFITARVFDIDGDGFRDVIAGGYSTGASLDIYRSTTPRVASSWTREVISTAGAIVSIEVRDMDGDGDQDLVISDRFSPGALKGVRWMKNPTVGGGSWTSHSIYQIGDSRWISISADGKTIVGGTSSTVPPSTTFVLTCGQANPSSCNPVGGSAPAWAKTTITEPTNAGLFNQGRLADIDGDADEDIVIVYHHAYDDLSNVLWLRNDGGVYTRGEISGVDGVKSDNFELLDVDCDGDLDVVVTDEGIRGNAAVIPLGLVWYENKFGVP